MENVRNCHRLKLPCPCFATRLLVEGLYGGKRCMFVLPLNRRVEKRIHSLIVSQTLANTDTDTTRSKQSRKIGNLEWHVHAISGEDAKHL